MSHKLRQGFSAFVNTTDEQVINTLTGPVMQRLQVFVEPGGVLPDNLAGGELERLDKMGAFTDPPPIEQRVQGVIANNPQMLHATAPEGEAVATPSDIRSVTEDEEDALERLAEAQQDVRDARAKADHESGADKAKPVEGLSTVPQHAAEPVPHVPAEHADESPGEQEEHTKPKAPAKKAATKEAAGTKKSTAKKAGSVHGR